MVFHGMVLYSDGGTIGANPGPSGGGLHGYFYLLSENKKQRIPDNIATNKGYVPKNQKVKSLDIEYHSSVPFEEIKDYITGEQLYPVTITGFIDAFSGNMELEGKGSNNAAELKGMIIAFRTLIQYQSPYTLIYSDSQYVITGLTRMMPNWLATDFVKPDGSIIQNKELWLTLNELSETAKEMGLLVNIQWIKGHKGHLGNECADRLAKLGAAKVSRNLMNLPVETDYVLTCEENINEYWKKEETCHPLLAESKRFIWNPKHDQVYQEQHLYRLINLGDGQLNDQIGKNVSDSGYALIQLNENDFVIDEVKNIQRDHIRSHGFNEDVVIVGNLDLITNKKGYTELKELKDEAFIASKKFRPDLRRYNNDYLTEIIQPKFLVDRAVDAFGHLDFILKEHQKETLTPEGSSNHLYNFTSSLYEESFKEDKKTKEKISEGLKLKKDFGSGVNGLELDLSEMIPNRKLYLTFGIDLPRRNVLKRLENYHPKVELYLEKLDALVYRYYVIVTLEHTGEKAVYRSSHANTLFLF